MESYAYEYPCLRPVEAIPDARNERLILRDPTQLATGMLVVGEAELVLLSLLDGQSTRRQVQGEYARRCGQLLPAAHLDALLEQLAGAGFLAGPRFESYYEARVTEYRAAPYRPLRDPDSYGAPARSLARYLDRALDEAAEALAPPDGRLAGLVAPHLDFPRGRPCYGAPYRHLRGGGTPRRAVVLGTNHFGRSSSVVATEKDFQTPWGVVPTDREFLARLQEDCGGNLMPYELDHLHEHSIELQAIWLHHLLGDGVRIVPFLCPDPSGPSGTAPGDPHGVDLRRFALALGRLVREDSEPTLLLASADLSHVGAGEEQPLDRAVLRAVRAADEAALVFVDRNDPEALREHMAGTRNPTRWCSIGCLYAMMVALGPDARAHRLRYHQAVTQEIENCVTCAAYTFHDFHA